tara:strand:- start:181 stop:480 length:300 start_codon:yes stop_codon:yes gene_type:complete
MGEDALGSTIALTDAVAVEVVPWNERLEDLTTRSTFRFDIFLFNAMERTCKDFSLECCTNNSKEARESQSLPRLLLLPVLVLRFAPLLSELQLVLDPLP